MHVPLTRPPAAPPVPMLDMDGLAGLLGVSHRHIRRLVESGKCPAPCRLGRCLRWARPTIEAWIAEGCPPCRKAGRATR
jgi:excisionase family DNA binding protein